MDYTNDIKEYFDNVKKTLDQVSKESLSEIINILNHARDSHKNIFICGNGGSASTASHYCCDFNKGVSSNQASKFRFICLGDNIPTMMAYANDTSYNNIFVCPLENLFLPGDYVIGISGSGNSENVVKAIEFANQNKGISIGITGYDGGRIMKIAQYNINVPINNMQISEDIHMIFDHCMMTILCKYGERR